MKTHKGVTALLRAAERERRCAIGENRALYHALRRRTKSLEVTSPYPNLFADAAYWESLNPEERSLHVIRALARLHPKWIFAGLSAACVYGYQHGYSLHDGSVFIACEHGRNAADASKLRRLYIRTDILRYTCNGIPVTSPAQTLLDCAAYPFANALAIYDSAFRTPYAKPEEVRARMLRVNCDESAVTRLLRHADSRSENGGESFARGRMIELGFAVPALQVEFDNPDNHRMPYRVDFCWKLSDGRVIIAEFDGTAKYRDGSNKNRASIQAKLDYERRREHHLKEAGVTAIVHLFYEDVTVDDRLRSKLLSSGVPYLR
ncbi:hypothetical protein [Bifidobacterium platyrrhinorum]|uniref:CTP synthase n=1 Tax=Bifidobacterium platyrrhinorum TaxID=2661628 RepID=A0A6L9SPZ0_9BIFI|nr:hypothetical protein [Bifidobacterium platyrrhinorum]NEG54607.1 hypothetical protein [Bifidobacterium platyrrhinorum]